MIANFEKYQGTGNDFIILTDLEKTFPVHETELIKKLCNRRFGIGADGFILVHPEKGYDFKMAYFNSDGRESTMCGNGGRCFARYLSEQKLVNKSEIEFMAIDGPHHAIIDKTSAGVSLHMADVQALEQIGNDFFLNTGSPHYVIPYAADLTELSIVTEARKIRNNERYRNEGVNVNFYNETQGALSVRTYERGVEDETYSCGTGVTAVAIASKAGQLPGKYQVAVSTPGGQLSIVFEKVSENEYRNIWLSGPAVHVFSGMFEY